MSDELVILESEVEVESASSPAPRSGSAITLASPRYGRVVLVGCRHWRPKYVIPFVRQMSSSTRVVCFDTSSTFDINIKIIASMFENWLEVSDLFEGEYDRGVDRVIAFTCGEGGGRNVDIMVAAALVRRIPVTRVGGCCSEDWSGVAIEETIFTWQP